jgi:predicted enzyme related to lactoylglutathione lyase
MLQDAKAISSYSVRDIKVSQEFYTQTLGLKTDINQMGILNVTFGSGNTVMMYPKADHVPATFTVLNFQVDNLEQTVDALIEKGITFEQYDSEYMKTDQKGIVRSGDPTRGPNIAWFKDPSDNIIAIMETE